MRDLLWWIGAVALVLLVVTVGHLRVLWTKNVTIHDLKTWPDFYSAVQAGVKTAEWRKDDREFRPGHFLRLREWDPGKEAYTGRYLLVKVTHLLRGPTFNVPTGWVMMSFRPVSPLAQLLMWVRRIWPCSGKTVVAHEFVLTPQEAQDACTCLGLIAEDLKNAVPINEAAASTVAREADRFERLAERLMPAFEHFDPDMVPDYDLDPAWIAAAAEMPLPPMPKLTEEQWRQWARHGADELEAMGSPVMAKAVKRVLSEVEHLRTSLAEIAKFSKAHNGDQSVHVLLHALVVDIPDHVRVALSGKE